MTEYLPYRSVVAIAVVCIAVLSGCAAYPFVGPSCGPGDTDIGAATDGGGDVRIKGEVTAMHDNRFVLDDGTGQATIVPLRGVPSEVSTGDCIIAEGQPSTSTDGNADISMVPTVLLEEEVTIEEN